MKLVGLNYIFLFKCHFVLIELLALKNSVDLIMLIIIF